MVAPDSVRGHHRCHANDTRAARELPRPLLTCVFWSGRRDLNPRPLDPQDVGLDVPTGQSCHVGEQPV